MNYDQASHIFWICKGSTSGSDDCCVFSRVQRLVLMAARYKSLHIISLYTTPPTIRSFSHNLIIIGGNLCIKLAGKCLDINTKYWIHLLKVTDKDTKNKGILRTIGSVNLHVTDIYVAIHFASFYSEDGQIDRCFCLKHFLFRQIVLLSMWYIEISRFILFSSSIFQQQFSTDRHTSSDQHKTPTGAAWCCWCCYRVLWSCGAAAEVLLRCCGAVECGVTDTHIYLVTGMGDTCDNSSHYRHV